MTVLGPVEGTAKAFSRVSEEEGAVQALRWARLVRLHKGYLPADVATLFEDWCKANEVHVERAPDADASTVDVVSFIEGRWLALARGGGMAAKRNCTKCGKAFPATREHFGGTPSGGLRGSCRRCMSAHATAWNSRNPEKREAVKQRRVDAGVWFRVTRSDRARMVERQGGRCIYCGEKLLVDDAHADHATPIKLGGKHSYRNLVAACHRCNGEKHAKTVAQYAAFRAERGQAPLWCLERVALNCEDHGASRGPRLYKALAGCAKCEPLKGVLA